MTGLPESTGGCYYLAKNRVHQILSGATADPLSRAVSLGLIGLILLNVLAVMAESVASIRTSYGGQLTAFEVISLTIFVTEYLLRIWSCPVDLRYRHPLTGRIRFALTPLAIIDLLAVLPSLLFWAGIACDSCVYCAWRGWCVWLSWGDTRARCRRSGKSCGASGRNW